ncbi:MAG: hypothetical protein Q8O14_15140 [bacterium]|nr:hypothetical protein [bacterium]
MLLLHRRDLGCAVLHGDAGELPTIVRRRSQARALNACMMLSMLGLVPFLVRPPGGETGFGVGIPLFVISLIWCRQAYFRRLSLPGATPRRAPDRRHLRLVMVWAVAIAVVIALVGKILAGASGEDLRQAWIASGAVTAAGLIGLAWNLSRLPRAQD